MHEASPTFARPTWWVMLNATFSRASEDGLMRSRWQDGLLTGESGPGAALASPSVQPVQDAGSTIPGISGPSGSVSLRSAALQSSLESRLRALLNGSDLCEVIWKPWATPWGSCLSKPRARVRTTSATDTGLWPTPTQRDWKSGTGAQPREGHAPPLSSKVGGQLNPTWVEWLMGWPLGWTDLKPLVMDKCPNAPNLHGALSAKDCSETP